MMNCSLCHYKIMLASGASPSPTGTSSWLSMGCNLTWVMKSFGSYATVSQVKSCTAQSLLSATQNDLGALLQQVEQALTVPILAVVSDGQHSIRKAVQHALPNTPHQLCHFHYLREAARPIYEADRHAKKELKK